MKLFKRQAIVETASAGSGFIDSLLGRNNGKMDSYPAQLMDGLKANPYVFRAIDIIGSTLSSIPLTVEDDADNVVETHPWQMILRNPNPTSTQSKFIRDYAASYKLNGNAYIERMAGVFEVKELWIIPPDHIQYDASNDIYHPVKQWKINTGMGTKAVSIEDICHVHTAISSDPVLGTSPLSTIALSISQQTSARQWNNSMMDNGCKPPLTINIKESLTEEEYNRFKGRFQASMAGVANAGRILVLDGGKTSSPMGMTAIDMDYVQGMTLSGKEIALGMGMPSEMLGDSSNKTYSNYQEATTSFISHTIEPMMVDLVSALTQLLRTSDKDGKYHVSYDKGIMDALKGDKSGQIAALTGAYFLTINERRAALGYPILKDVPEADMILMPMGQVPIGEMTEGSPEGDDET